MTITYHKDLIQGSDEWFAIRCGKLTASEMSKIITPTLKVADNDDTRSHVYEIAAQRVNQYVEPSYIGDDMMRGHEEEVLARIKYSENYSPVDDVGFVTNDEWGFTIGYSPDGLVGDDGLIECKSRKQKYQFETIISRGMPENKKLNCMIQIQTGLLVTKRKWCDFLSYHGGMHMMVARILPNFEMQESIIRASTAFEGKVNDKIAEYHAAIRELNLLPTERVIEEEMI